MAAEFTNKTLWSGFERIVMQRRILILLQTHYYFNRLTPRTPECIVVRCICKILEMCSSQQHAQALARKLVKDKFGEVAEVLQIASSLKHLIEQDLILPHVASIARRAVHDLPGSRRNELPRSPLHFPCNRASVWGLKIVNIYIGMIMTKCPPSFPCACRAAWLPLSSGRRTFPDLCAPRIAGRLHQADGQRSSDAA